VMLRAMWIGSGGVQLEREEDRVVSGLIGSRYGM
jgi:hypothetical protein